MAEINNNFLNSENTLGLTGASTQPSLHGEENRAALAQRIKDLIRAADHVPFPPHIATPPLHLLKLSDTGGTNPSTPDLTNNGPLAALCDFLGKSPVVQKFSETSPLIKHLSQAIAHVPKSPEKDLISANIAALITAALIDKVAAQQGAVSGRQSIVNARTAALTQVTQVNAAQNEKAAGLKQADASLQQANIMNQEATMGIISACIGIFFSCLSIASVAGSVLATEAEAVAAAPVAGAAEGGTEMQNMAENVAGEAADGAGDAAPEGGGAAAAAPAQGAAAAVRTGIRSFLGVRAEVWTGLGPISQTLNAALTSVTTAVISTEKSRLQAIASTDTSAAAIAKLAADTNTAMAGYFQNYAGSAQQGAGSSSENTNATIAAAKALKEAASGSASAIFKA
ncbi:MAG: hypothetical protein NTY13_04775 [Chlamydiae bacterium]|nr:hypothetical protein [Chlamydiota bacterium]